MPDTSPAESDALKEMEQLKDEVAAAAVQEVRPVSQRPRIISNDPQAEIIKGNVRESCAWVESPALLRCLKVSTTRLHKVASIKHGLPVTSVEKVRASILEGETKVYIYEADKEDLSGITVNYTKSGCASMNLISLLAPNKMTIQSGYKVRYEINFSKPSDPFYPALVLDLGAPKEKKLVNRRRGPRQARPEVGETEGAE